MTPDKLRELRRMILAMIPVHDYQASAQREAIALIDAELALHSTAEIAGTRAGLAELDREALRAQLAEVTRERDALIQAGKTLLLGRTVPPSETVNALLVLTESPGALKDWLESHQL